MSFEYTRQYLGIYRTVFRVILKATVECFEEECLKSVVYVIGRMCDTIFLVFRNIMLILDFGRYSFSCELPLESTPASKREAC